MKKKILIVDDEQDMLTLIELNLIDHGYKVLKCLNGTEALNVVKQEHPDLVLLDIVLDDMDGYTVCEGIKKTNPAIKVIIYTGKMEGVNAIRARSAGSDDFVLKTHDLEYIIAAIKNLFNEPDVK
ncbi:MAG: response regulator [Candidatus Omnitrophica bacterium]|nr:response regulator [Candidatus Omnitrophota bacterium]